jgi:hypothetical protein
MTVVVGDRWLESAVFGSAVASVDIGETKWQYYTRMDYRHGMT